MTDIESRLRGTLTDERRTLDAPPDVSAWVAAGVSRQRKRMAAAATIATVAVLALGSAVVLPIVLRDDPATHVAGAPDQETGLLPWEPVGSLIEDSAAIDSAVKAWSDDAPASQQPVGDVYVVMIGDDAVDLVATGSATEDGAYLQGHSEDGSALLAFLSRTHPSEPWHLISTSVLVEPDITEVLVVPSPAAAKISDSRTAAILAPQWREARDREDPIGWTRTANEPSIKFSAWHPVYRSSTADWLTELDASISGEVAHELLLGKGNGVARVVQVPASGNAQYVGTESGTILRSADGTPPEPWVLDPGTVLSEALGIGPEVSMTQIEMAQRLAVVGPLNARSERIIQMSVILFEPEDGRRIIGAAVQKVSGRMICGTRKFVPDDVLRRYVVAAVCPVPLSTGKRSLWLLGRWHIGEPIDQGLDLTLDVERPEQAVSTSNVTQRPGGSLNEWIVSSNPSPYSRFVVRGTDPFEGTPFEPWIWPARWLPTR